MLINQIAVFLENKKGSLLTLAGALAEAKINIVNLNIADTADYGIARLITADNKKALEVIESNGLTASTQNLVGIRVDDTPGSMQKMLTVMCENEVQIEYLYSYTLQNGKTMILFKTSDTDLAQKLIEEHNIA